MNEVKWIKIVTDIFDDEKMLAIETMPDGWNIEVVWFKILCLAGKCNQNGFLSINNKLAYTDEMLSKVFRMDIGIVQRALDVFQSLEMIEVVDNTYMVSNWLMHQSGDRLEEVREKNRIRQQRFRDNQKTKKIEQKDDRNVTNNVTNNVTSSLSISNIYIFSNLLNISNEEYISYIKENIDIKECIEVWMKYKDEKKPKSNNHYTETGMMTLLKNIYKNCKECGKDAVISAIEDSMGNNYQGIVWDYLKKKPKETPKNGGWDSVKV